MLQKVKVHDINEPFENNKTYTERSLAAYSQADEQEQKLAPCVDFFYQLLPLKRHLKTSNLEKINRHAGSKQDTFWQEKSNFSTKVTSLNMQETPL